MSDQVYISRGVITLPATWENKTPRIVPIRPLGKGMFTKAYVTTQQRKPTVYLVTEDQVYDKEILREISRNTSSKHLPRVEEVGYTHNATVYRMPLYHSPLRKGESPQAWAQYQVLRQCWKEADELVYGRSRWNRNIWDGHKLINAVVECARHRKLPRGLVRALKLLQDTSGNYGSTYSFEFSPRNLATDDKGNLILLDVLFNQENVMKKAGRRGLAVRRYR